MRPGDFNLLLHFDALMCARSVSKAAQELQISQPAMSSALSRLRRLFNDPILERNGAAWRPTVRAMDLHAGLRPMLDLWRNESLPRDLFEPQSSHRSFTVFGTDYVQYALWGPVLELLTTQAPNIKFSVISARPHSGLELLESNQVELMAGFFPDPQANLRTRFLFDEPAVCLVREGHPCLTKRWDAEAYLSYRHIALSSNTGHFSQSIKEAVDSMGLTRQVAVTLSSYLACPSVVGRTDLIATLPTSIARNFAKSTATRLLEVPIVLPTLSVSLYWHERHHRDPGHSWLRQLIGSLFRK